MTHNPYNPYMRSNMTLMAIASYLSPTTMARIIEDQAGVMDDSKARAIVAMTLAAMFYNCGRDDVVEELQKVGIDIKSDLFKYSDIYAYVAQF